MDKTYLPDLISGLEQELLRLGYTKGSMTFPHKGLSGPPYAKQVTMQSKSMESLFQAIFSCAALHSLRRYL